LAYSHCLPLTNTVNRTDQVRHFQTNSLQTCSLTYAQKTDWLLDCDVDEFYVVPHSLVSYSRQVPLLPSDMPDKPLLRLLENNWLYQTADVVAVSRVTYKNGGIQKMAEDMSVLALQVRLLLLLLSPFDHELTHFHILPAPEVRLFSPFPPLPLCS
jgi:hypothetical protein